jgi:prevent-host-death family protein
MSEMVNVHQAKTQLSRLLERAHSGEEIVLAKAGKPYARLVPLERKPRVPGIVEGRVDDAFFEPLPDEELRLWEQ